MTKRLTRSATLGALVALMALVLTLLSPLMSDGVALAADKPGRTATPAKVKVEGQDPKAAQNGAVINHKNGADVVQLAISLNYRHQDKLNTLLAELNDPASPRYHQFLTSAQFAREFGASASDVAQVREFMATNGLVVTQVSADNTLIDVLGTTTQVEQAFNVTLNNYRDNAGRTYYAHDKTPEVPAALSGLVLNIGGLENESRWRPASLRPQVNPNVGSGPAGGYTPSELRGAYDINPLISGGYNGTSQTVAVFELDGYVKSNVATYVSNYGLGSPVPSNILVDGFNGSAGSGEVEVELDIEVVNAIAPKAQVLVYEGPNSSAGVVDTYKKIATDNTAKVISSSWGQCEPQSSQSDINSEDQVFQQYAAQGQSMFAAAGDTGAYDCRGNTTTLAVDNPADDPYVTGVGGTNLTLSGTTYSSEKVWNVSSSSAGGGGGGGTPTQLITNGGFESGRSPWTETSTGGYEIVDSSASSVHHSGSASAWLCGYNNCTDTIYQTVTIAASATSVTLTFYVYITTQETSHSYDFFTAQIRNTSGTALATVAQYSDGSTRGSWQTVTYNLTSYKGQTVQIYFKGTNDSSNPTNFFLDDVGVVSQ